jgi:hypothetical protein
MFGCVSWKVLQFPSAVFPGRFDGVDEPHLHQPKSPRAGRSNTNTVDGVVSIQVFFITSDYAFLRLRWTSIATSHHCKPLAYMSSQLKCSDETKDQSCMNCVIYGVKCQYTPPYSPGGSRKKGDLSVGKAATGAGIKKRTTTKDRGSTSPGLLDNPDSPASSYADDVIFPGQGGQSMLPKFAGARSLASGACSLGSGVIRIEMMRTRYTSLST